MYIANSDNFPYNTYHSNNSKIIEELHLILNNSNIPFYLELFNFENIKSVYSYKSKLTQIYNINFISDSFYPRIYLEDQKKKPTKLYYKNILVKDFRYIYAQLPYNFEIFGMIDYLGPDLKLDVSRNEIIEGNSKVNAELNAILLKYFIAVEKSEPKKEFLNSILAFVTNNL